MVKEVQLLTVKLEHLFGCDQRLATLLNMDEISHFLDDAPPVRCLSLHLGCLLEFESVGAPADGNAPP